MSGKSNMTPEEERAWTSMAQDGSLRRWANSVTTSPYDLAYEAFLRRRVKELAS